MRDDELLSIRLTHLDGVAVLSIRGEIDSFTASRLKRSIEEVRQLGAPIVLDMASVTFMDSAGVGVLIAASRTADGPPCSVRITEPSEQVHRLLSITGLDKVLMPEP